MTWTAPGERPADTVAVRVDHVTVTFGGAPILDDVSLTVPRGAWLALLGPNGAGKTTLLRAIAGLVAPSTGTVRLGGHDVRDVRRRELARRVAFVDQRPVLPPGMLVHEYVLLGRTAHLPLLAHEGPADRAAVAEAMARLDVERHADRDVLTLSGGEAQRVVLARALAQEAPLLLLDEPTAALDLAHQHTVLELVDELRAERGLTVVSSLHDLTTAGQFAQDAVLLACGQVQASGPVASVLDESLLARTYGADVRVVDDGAGGLLVVPVRTRPAEGRARS